MADFSSQDKLAAIQREIGYRRRVYVRRVADKAMTQELADRQIAIFEAIEKDYEMLIGKERLI